MGLGGPARGRAAGGGEGASSGEAAAPRGALLGSSGRPSARPRQLLRSAAPCHCPAGPAGQGTAPHRGETLLPARPSGQGKRNRARLGWAPPRESCRDPAPGRRPGAAGRARGGLRSRPAELGASRVSGLAEAGGEALRRQTLPHPLPHPGPSAPCGGVCAPQVTRARCSGNTGVCVRERKHVTPAARCVSSAAGPPVLKL
ncbi:circumsporozoite protein-like isoform X2 [Aquila chrysaetos chrysaetos]|uniref:circumsporozoite protein-like isoform X2 n=1 Tax=Aquila chrysaetos chrysaetos TaxID=223781 RepID=UPI00117676D5|nr:circumsporozoite protein-like isoform X2 [Aquila chrysaetos chrysaetos]